MNKIHLASLLSACLIFTGCTSNSISTNSHDLTKDIKKSNLSAINIASSDYQKSNPKGKLTNFSLQLLHNNFDGENILMSPLSILTALSMTTNGAAGETLSQMETALGSDSNTLNQYLKAYTQSLSNTKECQFNMANSIWIKDTDDLTVNQNFLQTCKDYYETSIFTSPFDQSTQKDINTWVNLQTEGMIPSILEEPPSDDALIYLINALSFEAEWDEIYKDTQIHQGEFITVDNKKQEVEFMHSTEYNYLESENATGFIKPYKDNQYAFVALLPNENIEMEDFLNTLTGEDLIELISNPIEQSVITQIPKFSTEYDVNLRDSLPVLGMTDAFNSNLANFSTLAHSESGNLFISKILHKTKIEVQEQGTKAGAATVVEVTSESAMEADTPKTVSLDRPFFYMIIDTNQHFPIFIGSLMQIDS